MMDTLMKKDSRWFGFIILSVFVTPLAYSATSFILNGDSCGVVTELKIQAAGEIDGDSTVSIATEDAGGCGLNTIYVEPNKEVTMLEGESIVVDVLEGVRAEWPVSIEALVTAPAGLGAAESDGSGGIRFTASNPGQVVVSYHLEDNAGLRSNDGKITITIQQNATGGTGGECMEEGLIKCMGNDPALDTGGFVIKTIGVGEIHVWEINYSNHSLYGTEQFRISQTDSSVNLKLSISKYAGNMDFGVDGNSSCINMLNYVPISNIASNADYYCVLKEGENYFLNVHNVGVDTNNDGEFEPAAGYYTLAR